jgi:hypothetical protein
VCKASRYCTIFKNCLFETMLPDNLATYIHAGIYNNHLLSNQLGFSRH